jgi:hypothetical protein
VNAWKPSREKCAPNAKGYGDFFAPADTNEDLGLQGQSGRCQGQTDESGSKDVVIVLAQTDTHDHSVPQDLSGRF